MAVRKDTLTLTFERVRGRPSNLELCNWLKSELSVSVADLLCVEPEVGTLCTHLLFKDGTKVQKFIEEGEERSFTYADGREGKVLLSTSGVGFKVVRVRRLPATVSDDDVALFMNLYGKVQSVMKEKWPRGSVFEGLWTGARLVKMVVKENIPSFRTIAGVEAFVDYPGQLRTCQICAATDHLKVNCPKRGERFSYANRLSRRSGPETPVVDNEEDVFFNGRKRAGSSVSGDGGKSTGEGSGKTVLETPEFEVNSDGAEKEEDGRSRTSDDETYDFSIFNDTAEQRMRPVSIPLDASDISRKLALLRDDCENATAPPEGATSTAETSTADDTTAAPPADRKVKCFVNASGLGAEEEFPPLPPLLLPPPPSPATEPRLAASPGCPAEQVAAPAAAATPSSTEKPSLLPVAQAMLKNMEKYKTTKLPSTNIVPAVKPAVRAKRDREEHPAEQSHTNKKSQRGGKKAPSSTANRK